MKKIHFLASTLTIIAVFQLFYLPVLIEEARNAGYVSMDVSDQSPIATSATTAMASDGSFEYYTGPYTCSITGHSKTGEGILDTYVVKKGDSLLSIANDIYSDPTKVADIVYLNSFRYNSLSTSDPFIEIGWEFLLPEPDISMISSGFEISSGQVYILKEGQIILRTGVGSGGSHYYPNQVTKELPDLKLGDCVSIFHKTHTTVYKVELQ